MKHLFTGLVLATLSLSTVSASAMSFDLPRLDFPAQGAEVTQLCSLVTQSCGK